MAAPKLSKYDVNINGIKHTLKLSAEDAERMGDVITPVKESKAPANKAVTPANK